MRSRGHRVDDRRDLFLVIIRSWTHNCPVSTERSELEGKWVRLEEQGRGKEMEDNGLRAEESDCVHICSSISLGDPDTLFSALAQSFSLLS